MHVFQLLSAWAICFSVQTLAFRFTLGGLQVAQARQHLFGLSTNHENELSVSDFWREWDKALTQDRQKLLSVVQTEIEAMTGASRELAEKGRHLAARHIDAFQDLNDTMTAKGINPANVIGMVNLTIHDAALRDIQERFADHEPFEIAHKDNVKIAMGIMFADVGRVLKDLDLLDEDTMEILGRMEKSSVDIAGYIGDVMKQNPELVLFTFVMVLAGLEATILADILECIGFGARGVLRGSIAARFQSIFFGGCIPAGSFFATLQRLAQLAAFPTFLESVVSCVIFIWVILGIRACCMNIGGYQ